MNIHKFSNGLNLLYKIGKAQVASKGTIPIPQEEQV